MPRKETIEIDKKCVGEAFVQKWMMNDDTYQLRILLPIF